MNITLLIRILGAVAIGLGVISLGFSLYFYAQGQPVDRHGLTISLICVLLGVFVLVKNRRSQQP
jgi:predicted permease